VIETARSADGRLDIHMRGERFDGRRLIKRLLADLQDTPSNASGPDFDLHIEVATLEGFNGEPLHGVDMSLTRRAGRIDDFALTASIAEHAVHGGVRNRRDNGRILFVEADEAGAFLRFVDLYANLANGRMWLALDFPVLKEGVLSIRDFDVPPDAVLKPLRDAMALLSWKDPNDAAPGLSRLRAAFVLAPGKFVLNEARFYNNAAGATMEGRIEGSELDLRGVLDAAVLADPRSAPCASFACMRGLQYRVTGSLQSPRVLINPILEPLSRDFLLPP
jgi:hypothetical protein